MELADTHCHIHEAVRKTTPVYEKWHAKGEADVESMLKAATEAGVTKLICVGTTLADSELAIEFVQNRPNTWASIGIHPHEAHKHLEKAAQDAFAGLAARPKVIAVGECGLDYFYAHSPKEDQIQLLHFQLALAQKHDLPVIFHVREAFEDFWPIFDQYKGVRGVLHSYTDNQANLQIALQKGLYICVNGIATFAKAPEQLAMYRAIPLTSLLLETDAPFLTPVPHRGKMNEPKYVRVTAEFLADVRGERLLDLAAATTANATALFGI